MIYSASIFEIYCSPKVNKEINGHREIGVPAPPTVRCYIAGSRSFGFSLPRVVPTERRMPCDCKYIDASKGFVALWVHLSFAIFAIWDLKRQLKLLEMAFDQVKTCLIFPFRWAHFPIKNSRKAQWVHPISMNFNGSRPVCLYFSLKSIFDEKIIFQWEPHILSIKGCHAIRPE